MRGKGIKEEEQTIALLENRQTDRQTVEEPRPRTSPKIA